MVVDAPFAFLIVEVENGVDVLPYLSLFTSGSHITTPIFETTLKNSFFGTDPTLFKSKNLNVFRRSDSADTFDDALKFNLFLNSFSKLN